ncbi:SDR family NAD(P)-dependent oxidoreductase [Mycobacterium sp. MYCO198283]|uniref:SDR family oxidoreductase n=1 Tax=Mycobacterium sp. MYCO198283 TaxID=2883505 RepID=UPI001E63C12B|nr:SDR family NAD(P)-dependent oxidoreductase [Mycobacterium sp. MYCO198283]MCG5432922.1 SDR family NAD(P)-dependent oxidoreductase [Mycobacterium sp. MYCO198283]
MTGALTGTVALVTGASSGIGAATAAELATHGAAVALLARRGARLEELVSAIRDAGGSALAVPADVTSRDAVRDAIAAVIDGFGRLDTVVNNAGQLIMGPAAEASLDDWDRLLEVNVRGVLYVTRAALPHLIDAATSSPRGVADLVTIGSTGGWVARGGTAVYSLTKFGVNAFSEGLRQELVGRRVRVGVVSPGTVDTEINSHLPQRFQDAFARTTADMEKLRPADVADAVGYMVTRDRRVAVNHILVRAGEQTW